MNRATLRLALGLTVLLLASLPRESAAKSIRDSHKLGFLLGGQAGITGAPGGFKLGLEYGYKLSPKNWFNGQANFVAGGRGCYYGPGRDPYPYYRGCGAWSGSTIELAGGIKMKFQTKYDRLVPYAKFGGGINFIFFPYSNDDGIAPVFRGGGGVKYYVLDTLALGGEMDLAVGPAFVGCGPNCNDVFAYVALDFLVGLEWNF